MCYIVTCNEMGNHVFGLKTLLILYILLPVMLAMSFAAVWAVSSLERHMEKRMQEDVELVARSIQRPLADALERDRPGAAQHALESAFRIDRVFGVYVYDADGDRVAAAGEEERLPPSDHLSDLAAGERTGEYGQVAGRTVYSYFVPLSDTGGQIIALLQVTRRASDFEDYFRALRWQAGGLLVLSWVVVATLVLIGHKRVVGGPLERLLQSIARVAGGDPRHRAVESGPREIAHVAERLNDMLDSIERAEIEIATRQRQEEALREKLRHSERLAAIGRLAAGVAHELGTPLSVIAGRAQRALRTSTPGSPATLALEETCAQIRRMDTVVRQLLELGRREPPSSRPVSVAQVCRSSVVAVRDLADDHGVHVELHAPADDVVMELEPNSLERVLINLLRNGIQASERGLVRLSWRTGETGLWLSVDDDGPGVEDGEEGRIFEPFFTTKAPGAGTGLGLSVAHSLLQELGGRIDVKQSPFGGARFTVFLPRSMEPQEVSP